MRIVVHDYAGHAFPTSLSRALAKRGHEVVHAFAGSLQTPRGDLTNHPDDPPTLSFKELPMNPEYIKYKYSFLRRRNMEVGYGKQAAAFIREWKPDAVLSGNTPTESQEPISRAAVANGGRFYYWVQDFYSLAVDQLLRRKIPVLGAAVGSWYRSLDRRQFDRSSKVIGITEDFAPILNREFGVTPARIETVPNWALIENIPALVKNNQWARKLNLHDKFVFLYSGTIGMKHNPALVLELARKFSDHPDTRIVVVSEGIGADWLKQQAQTAQLHNLVILPYQPFADLPEVLATGDVLIGILEKEAGRFSVPSKTLSYLCARRPLLLAMPLDNLAARITTDHDAGLVVDHQDMDGFLNSAARLFDSAETRKRLGANARTYAEQTFPIEPTAARFDRILSA
ncbi:MAG: glycosyltransferase family 4 protein [Verrucomicrobiales bacterium]|nr:glycosyltransferase family 4 protein [Verrucomicrobiota bacterium JB025]